MRIVLHIGTHKTGTSSIQRALYDARDRLQLHGYLYPDAGRPSPPMAHTGHHLLGFGLRRKRNVGLEAWEAIGKELSASSCTSAIISSEELSPATLEQIEVVRSYLAKHEVKVILYLRSHEGYAISNYKEWVKGQSHFSGSFEEFIELRQERLDYRGLVERWRTIFPDVRWISYDDNKHDIVGSFVSAVSIPPGVVAVTDRSNVSPGDAAICVTRWINYLQNQAPMLPLSRLRSAVLREQHIGKVLVRAYGAVGRGVICSQQDRDLIRRYATMPES